MESARVVVVVDAFDDWPVSRSEARRMLADQASPGDLILDFTGVEMIGQGFADEVFRVWASTHPGVTLRPVAMNSSVELMVRRTTAP